jgi:integrase
MKKLSEGTRGNVQLDAPAMLSPESHPGRPSPLEVEKMARRRYQKPKPFREGHWWWIKPWIDEFENGRLVRKQKRIKLAPASMKEREVKKIADEHLGPLNHGLGNAGAAIPFAEFVRESYVPTKLKLMAKSTQGRSQGIIDKYLIPTFGPLALRSVSTETIQRYFASDALDHLSHESRDKVRDVLSSILRTAKRYGYLQKNAADDVELPRPERIIKHKPYVRPEQFNALVDLIPEPYATMIFTAVFTGLRVSEIAGLRWRDVGADSITIEKRYCRGDYGAPKSIASAATISVNRAVIERIESLKGMTSRCELVLERGSTESSSMTALTIWFFNR